MDEVINYLLDGELPDDSKEAKRVKHKSGWFLWHEDQLYKKPFSHTLLMCITPEDGDYILKEIHEGACESHQGGRTIAGKALRTGYHWSTLKGDAHELVKICPSCQLHSDIPRAPTTPLTTFHVVMPFDK